jgi:hypothetical protein
MMLNNGEMEGSAVDEIRLDASMQALDANAQHVVVDAARTWVQQRISAPADDVRLLNTTTDTHVTIYEIEVDVGGTTDHVNVMLADNGSVEVQPAE